MSAASSAEGRATKLRRTEHFRRRVPHVSAAALSAICEDIEEHGVPELHDRNQFREARDHALEADNTQGPLMPEIDLTMKSGRTRKMLVVSPLALLWLAFTTCLAFRTFFLGTFGGAPVHA